MRYRGTRRSRRRWRYANGTWGVGGPSDADDVSGTDVGQAGGRAVPRADPPVRGRAGAGAVAPHVPGDRSRARGLLPRGADRLMAEILLGAFPFVLIFFGALLFLRWVTRRPE